MIFSTQSTHKLLAGLSQASQILVQYSEKRQLDRHRFNEAYLMHSSTSPQYAIIASCDVAAAMMEPPGGTGAGRGVDHRGARLPARDAQGRRRVRRLVVVQGVGAGRPRRGGHRQPRRLDAAARTSAGTASATSPTASTCSTRSRRRCSRRGSTSTASSPSRAFPRRSSPSTSPSTASSSRRPGCTRSSSCSRSASPRAAGTRWSPSSSSSRTTTTRTIRCGACCPSSCRRIRATRRSACASCATRSTASTRRTTSAGSRPRCT